MSDKTESDLKVNITRLRNIAKHKPMSLSQKLDVLAHVKKAEADLRAYRLAKV